MIKQLTNFEDAINSGFIGSGKIFSISSLKYSSLSSTLKLKTNL